MGFRVTLSHLEEQFPALRPTGYAVTSLATRRYNCIAWAAGDDGQWWWPDRGGVGFWPPGVPREVTLAAFEQAFATRGYSLCETSELETGRDKVAIFRP